MTKIRNPTALTRFTPTMLLYRKGNLPLKLLFKRYSQNKIQVTFLLDFT